MKITITKYSCVIWLMKLKVKIKLEVVQKTQTCYQSVSVCELCRTAWTYWQASLSVEEWTGIMGLSPLWSRCMYPYDRPFVRLLSKSWQPCSFNKVPDCPQPYDFYHPQGPRKRNSGSVWILLEFHSHTKHELRFSPLLPTSYTRNSQSTPLCRDVFSGCYV